MQVPKLYSTKTKNIFRVYAVSAITVLLLHYISGFSRLGFDEVFKNWFDVVIFILSLFAIFSFFSTLFYPQNLEFFAFGNFISSVIFFLTSPENTIGILLYFVSIISLYARGYFKKYEILKIILSSIILASLFLSELRFGLKSFSIFFFNNLLFFCAFLCATFIVRSYGFDLFIKNSPVKILDLKNYPSLKKRDCVWLSRIAKGEKYESIALDENLSLGTVQNRFKKIYNELEVGDKQGFLTKYDTFTICFGEEFSSLLTHA